MVGKLLYFQGSFLYVTIKKKRRKKSNKESGNSAMINYVKFKKIHLK